VSRAFRAQGPAAINVSGGRTSGYMLYRFLDAHDGRLPPDTVAIFCNTGHEMPATLDFVQAMGERWGVSIQWLEYRRSAETRRQWSEPVNHNSASRNGEPFDMLLEQRGWMLPGPKMRFCTEQLKMRTAQRWLTDELGWGWHRRYVGLRYDELHRVERVARRNALREDGHVASCPLARARITKPLVRQFWAQQPFDLGLKGDWEGNCDGCMLKRMGAIRRMWQEHPERMQWWADKEARAKLQGYTNGRFRIDREGFAEIGEDVRRNPMFPSVLDSDDTGFDVMADCEGGCGG
jgi:3'-phosphoadenosine 5'-phosphosulfate sulfotransferase (PAPS reductase)/FAD synthetase